MDVLKAALIQMPVVLDKDENISVAGDFIKRAKELGCDLAILPEIWNGPYDTNKFREYAESSGGKTYSAMSEFAKLNNIALIGGSITELCEDKVYNTSYVFDNSGVEIAKHRKWHLFDIDIKGGQRFKESDVLSPGDSHTVFELFGWKIGLGICFDIRFSSQAELMAGSDLVVYPAAFNTTTGPLHWELLFRARAMDLQAYAIGVAQSRSTSGYISWANSLMVDPWGTVRNNLGTKPNLQVVELFKETISDVRSQIPIGR